MNFSCFVYSVLLKCDNQQVCNAIFLFVSHSLLLEILLPKLNCLYIKLSIHLSIIHPLPLPCHAFDPLRDSCRDIGGPCTLAHH